jgi:cyclohexyl-isocyanide hydratase
MEEHILSTQATDGSPAVVARIGIYIYPDMTHLDCLGPHQILGSCPGLEVFTFARTADPLRTDTGLIVTPDYGFDAIPPCEVLLVGGTADAHPEMTDPAVLAALRRVGADARFVTSVCTGALILAAAGLLDGYRATTHWAMREVLASFAEVEVVNDRVVVDRNRITGGGITSGIDFAFSLIAVLIDQPTAQLMQLFAEYDPAPPYRTGTPELAPAEMVATMRQMAAAGAPELAALALAAMAK